MSFSQTEQHTITGAGATINASKTFIGDGHKQLEIAIGANVTDWPVNFWLDITQIQSFFMVCDQDVTVAFNDSTTGVPTIALKANVPFVERNIASGGNYYASLFTADITKIYLTNGTSIDATFKLSVVHDATTG